MSDHVLDASALLALLFDEPGADAVADLLETSVIGTVNLSEVVAKLQERGVPYEEIEQNLGALDLAVVPFDTAQALAAGKLRLPTRRHGLSLGDRACLALAMTERLPAVTADRTWSSLDLDVRVIAIR